MRMRMTKWNARVSALAAVGVLALSTSVKPAAARCTNCPYKVLYTFTGAADGGQPAGTLINDSAGNLYGTAQYGGTYGDGVVFKLSPSGQYTVLHSFYGTDGANPYAGVVQDAAGNLYGTTQWGGAYGYGTVYELLPNGVLNNLWYFTGGPDGAQPMGGVILDSAGNIYGTASSGGSGYGVVFAIKSGIFSVLHAFQGSSGNDGATPYSSLVLDPAGNLYGTTLQGSLNPSDSCPWPGCGTMFAIKAGIYQPLEDFNSLSQNTPTGLVRVGGWLAGVINTPNGFKVFQYGYGANTLVSPNAGSSFCWCTTPAADAEGNLYGTTNMGGTYLGGAVYRIDTFGNAGTLYNFAQSTGYVPYGGLLASGSYLYGTTSAGGTYNQGVIFQLLQ